MNASIGLRTHAVLATTGTAGRTGTRKAVVAGRAQVVHRRGERVLLDPTGEQCDLLGGQRLAFRGIRSLTSVAETR
jgi:hypothetical protein